MRVVNGGGDYHPPPTASELVTAMIATGAAMPVQANVKAGWIHYEFLGGVYDGVRLRLYPPFTQRISLDGDEWYVRSGPKNGRSKRLTYRLEE